MSDPHDGIEVSVVIPAYNEEAFLRKTIEHLQAALMACQVISEIIVVDNGSSDRTAAIAREQGAQVVYESKQQIARARNTGGFQAKGRFIIFLDADTIVHQGLIMSTLQILRSGNYIGGGALLELDEYHKATQRFLQSWNWISAKMKFAAGCYIFCLKSAFLQVGGFNEKIYASEEIWFIKRLKKYGKTLKLKTCIIEKERVKTSARKFTWFSPHLLILQILLFAFFPFLCRYKFFCFLWYKRPKSAQ